MGIIRVLPEAIANKIAAGEVIERPASIAKELVENSLDAGAKKIEVAVKHGGKSLILVADDGCGMNAEDAELAFARHATSKIFSAQDLDRIASYGFRGEALPSIAAVSRVKMTSRLRNASSGTELSIEGGKLQHVKECAAAPGTVMEVRDLFFNTPARRKFLKSDATELGHVSDTLSNLALSRLDVHFIFKSQDKIVFDLMPVSDVKLRAPAILGEETAKNLLDISGEDKGIKVRGVIAKPIVSRANRLGQTFFVNGRWVKAFPFSYALQAGYHGLLMQGQYPVAILYVELDLEKVDVNVHPTKQEIRISNETQVKSFIKELVAERLAKEVDMAPEIKSIAKENPWLSTLGAPTVTTSPSYRNPDAEQMIAELPVSFASQDTVELAEPFLIREGGLAITKILGQIHNTFIIAETEEGLMIIDQHAAHERIQFEALMKGFKENAPARQRLLMDEIVNVNERQAEILTESLELLNKIGFEVEVFGGNSFAVRTVPSVLSGENAAAVIKTFIEEKEEGKLRSQAENITEEVAALIACKRKSVKAHDRMNLPAVQTLLKQLAACEYPFSCPHGRPAFLKYSILDLEKQFKRKL